MYEISSAYVAIASLNSTVRDAMEETIPRGCNHKFKSPPPFPGSLIPQDITLLRIIISTVILKRKDRITFMTNSSSTEILLKTQV